MAKRGPIPIRFDEETTDALSALAERSDTTEADIIRRAVRLALQRVVDTGSITFLFDKHEKQTPAPHQFHPEGRSGTGLNEPRHRKSKAG